MNKTVIKHRYNIDDIVGHNGKVGEITEIVAYIKKDSIFYKYKTSIYDNIYLFEENLKLRK